MYTYLFWKGLHTGFWYTLQQKGKILEFTDILYKNLMTCKHLTYELSELMDQSVHVARPGVLPRMERYRYKSELNDNICYLYHIALRAICAKSIKLLYSSISLNYVLTRNQFLQV